MALSSPQHSNRGQKLWKSKTVKGMNHRQDRVPVLMNQEAFYKNKLTSNPLQTWFKHVFNTFFNIITLILKLNSGLCSRDYVIRVSQCFQALGKPHGSVMHVSKQTHNLGAVWLCECFLVVYVHIFTYFIFILLWV